MCYFSENIPFLVVFSIAKIFIILAGCIVYPLTTELYDTNIRSTAMAVHGSFSRLGGLFMPWIIYAFIYFIGD